MTSLKVMLQLFKSLVFLSLDSRIVSEVTRIPEKDHVICQYGIMYGRVTKGNLLLYIVLLL